MYQDTYSTARMSSWDLANNNASSYSLRSEQGPQNASVSTGKEMVPFSRYGSQNQTQFGTNDQLLQRSRQSNNPSRAPESFQTASKAPQSTSALQACKNQVTPTRVVGVIIGLILSGIPLAVVVTLYLTPVTTTTTTTTATTSVSTASRSTASTASTTVSNVYTLPYQCTSYTLNQDSTRNYAYSCGACYCDNSISGWYRFSGAAGTRLASSPVTTGYCGATYPGWYNGTHPTTIGATSIGSVCINVNGILCQVPYSIPAIYVTNCNGFYVYYLTPTPYCYSRYCTV